MTLRIVVADDHPIFLSGLEQLLASEPGFEVVARCTSGKEALEAVRRERPEVVLADLSMPGLTGMELLRELARQTPAPRVILITARIEHEQVTEAMSLGVGGIVLKESAAHQLVECVRNVAAGRQWIDQIIGSRTLDAILRRQAAKDRASRVLTPREIEVVRMVAAGLRNKEIAEALSISEGTVKVHLRVIFEKLGVESRLRLSVYAREHELV